MGVRPPSFQTSHRVAKAEDKGNCSRPVFQERAAIMGDTIELIKVN